MLDNHIYAVVLAGGSGTRFWPKSRHLSPKQLCRIGSESQTMLEVTLNRLDGLIPPENRLIVTHKDQAELTKKTVGDKCPKVLAEPMAKNTAAALAMAVLEIEKQHKDTSKKPIMISLHADHVIQKPDTFRQSLAEAAAVAETGNITLLGINQPGQIDSK